LLYFIGATSNLPAAGRFIEYWINAIIKRGELRLYRKEMSNEKKQFKTYNKGINYRRMVKKASFGGKNN